VRLALILLALLPATALAETWVSPGHRHYVLTDDGDYALVRRADGTPLPSRGLHMALPGDAVVRTGRLPWAPDQLHVLDDGGAFVGVDGERPGVFVVHADGRTLERSLDELFPPATLDGFWRTQDGAVAWRADWWVDEGTWRAIFVPPAPAAPVALSLVDGLAETPADQVFVDRLGARGLWFGSRLRALEQATALGVGARLDHALRRVVADHEAPVVLRLRAAAVLQSRGDAYGRGLVLLTARSTAPARGLEPQRVEELRLPAEPEVCERPPAGSFDLPHDHEAARSYAIHLLPTFLDADAAPLLRQLLASEDEGDRFAALQAIGCLVARRPEQRQALLAEVRQREAVEREQLGSVAAPSLPTPKGQRRTTMPLGEAAQAVAMALGPLLLLAALPWLRRLGART
jgi:hypothetical protein